MVAGRRRLRWWRWHVSSCAHLYVAVMLAVSSQLWTCSTSESQINSTELPPHYQHAETDADMHLLYQTCLQPDMAMHQDKQYTLRDIVDTLDAQRKLKYHKHLSLVVVRDGVMHVSSLSASLIPPSPSPRRLEMLHEAVVNSTHRGLVLPDSIFILCTWDEPRCPVRAPSRCPAPILSLVKTWNGDTNTSEHNDILVPFFNHIYQDIIEYPWANKTRKALMRASMQNGMPPTNTRLTLVQLSQSEKGKVVLDAGITQNLKAGMTLRLVPKVSMADHARWRYLISADGFTASCRLGKLLGINSVVIKETSRWIEYYYRALTPGQEFIPFTRATALQVLKSVDAMTDDQLLAVVSRAQRFQQMYLSQHAKMLYLRQVLLQYNQLFQGLNVSQFVHRLNVSRLNNLSYLISEMNKEGS